MSESYKCITCDKKITYPKVDRDFHYNHKWECPSCYCVLSTKRYQVNIRNGMTVFFPMGKALGDRISAQVVKERYIADNPDEKVVFLTEDNMGDYRAYDYDKLFFANMFNGGKSAMPSSAIWFSLRNEVNEFANQGYYPSIHFNNIVQNNRLNDNSNYVVFHLRCLDKAIEKNVQSHVVYSLLKRLSEYSELSNIYLVGNDNIPESLNVEVMKYILGKTVKVFDLRNSLSLTEIAYLLSKAFLFLGTDSGIAHVAAASKCPRNLIWGYQSKRWFIRTPEKAVNLTRKESSLDNILYALDNLI